MAEFIPKFINETEGTFLLLDNVFSHEDAITFAVKHKHDVKFICGTYTCATEILCKLYEAGYSLKPVRRRTTFPTGGGMDMFDTVYCYLTSAKEVDNDEVSTL